MTLGFWVGLDFLSNIIAKDPGAILCKISENSSRSGQEWNLKQTNKQKKEQCCYSTLNIGEIQEVLQQLE